MIHSFLLEKKILKTFIFPYNVIIVQSQIIYHFEKPEQGGDTYWKELS